LKVLVFWSNAVLADASGYYSYTNSPI
jgi:hypothetical protein